MSRNEDASSQGSALIDEDIEPHGEKEVSDDPERLIDAEKSPHVPDNNKAERKPLADRIRVPVAYDDLFEEGEIHEGDAPWSISKVLPFNPSWALILEANITEWEKGHVY